MTTRSEEDECSLTFHTLQALPRLRRDSSRSTGMSEQDLSDRFPSQRKTLSTPCSPHSKPNHPDGESGRSRSPIRGERSLKKVARRVRRKSLFLKNSALAQAIEAVLNYRTQSYCDFIDKVPSDEYFDLYMRISQKMVVATISNAHSIVSSYMLAEERKNRLQWLLQFARPNPEHEGILDRIFEVNGVNKGEWVSDLCKVLMECDNKKNTLFMCGAPNSGKTLLCRLICESFTCGYISLQGCAGVFYFESALNKSILGIDELWVIPGNADTWKNILAGDEFDCPKKNMSEQRMARTPCIITSNFSQLGRGFLDKIDEAAFRTRMYSYRFTRDVAHITKGVTVDYHSFAHWLSNEIKGLT